MCLRDATVSSYQSLLAGLTYQARLPPKDDIPLKRLTWNRANDTQIGVTAKLVAYMFTTGCRTLQQAHKGSNRITRKYTICRCWPIASNYTSF